MCCLAGGGENALGFEGVWGYLLHIQRALQLRSSVSTEQILRIKTRISWSYMCVTLKSAVCVGEQEVLAAFLLHIVFLSKVVLGGHEVTGTPICKLVCYGGPLVTPSMVVLFGVVSLFLMILSWKWCLSRRFICWWCTVLAWAWCHPKLGGDQQCATQGDVTIFISVVLVAMKRLGRERYLTVLIFTHHLCFILLVT